ncbi:hypothetical protein T492DRAFT_84885 [Pavlovales sp. CCMP2436]|nr:hypothetical protein T492DRAFT_84885 [Pavlovales sp. CCMP2436]
MVDAGDCCVRMEGDAEWELYDCQLVCGHASALRVEVQASAKLLRCKLGGEGHVGVSRIDTAYGSLQVRSPCCCCWCETSWCCCCCCWCETSCWCCCCCWCETSCCCCWCCRCETSWYCCCCRCAAFTHSLALQVRSPYPQPCVAGAQPLPTALRCRCAVLTHSLALQVRSPYPQPCPGPSPDPACGRSASFKKP